MFYRKIDNNIEDIQKEVLIHIHSSYPDQLLKNSYIFLDIENFKKSVPSIKTLLDDLEKIHNIEFYNKLDYIGLCTLLPEAILKPHIDCSPAMIGLNIPIQDCNKSLNRVWRGWIDSQWAIGDNVSGVEIDHTRAEVIEKYTLSKATWFLPKVPHSVFHAGEQTRIMISLRFTEDPLNIFYKEE